MPERIVDEVRANEVKFGRLVGLTLGAAILVVLVPGLVSFAWPERPGLPEPGVLARVVPPPASFESVWADARSPMSSLHPPPPAEPDAAQAPPVATPVVQQRRRSATTTAIPLPPERPGQAFATAADPAAAAPSPPVNSQRRERPRVLGLDMPTVDDAARLLDDAASLAGSVSRYLPRI